MTKALGALVAEWLAAPVASPVAQAAAIIAAVVGAEAMLFYGSVLRTGDLDGVLDFYALTEAPRSPPIWPRVSFHEVTVDGRVIRAKVATMPLRTFVRAARGTALDTTIWARFVQPCALVWSGAIGSAAIVEAVATAVETAARFSAALGPERGAAPDFWRALFRQTYRTEFRVEAAGREAEIVANAPEWFAATLPLAWERVGVPFDMDGEILHPRLPAGQRQHLLRRWRRRRIAGKPLNAIRLVRAAFTFDGAARYALWKVERHTGVALPLTRFRERHPVLAAPGVLWRLWRATR